MQLLQAAGVHLADGATMLSRRRSIALFSIAVFFSVAVPSASSQTSRNVLVCDPNTRVTVLDNGTVNYGQLPPTDPPNIEEYDPQGLAAWYGMARGFVDTVQPENLPYDVIENAIRENDLACSVRGNCSSTSGDADVEATLQDFGRWWAPLIGVTVFGGLLAIIFGCVGAFFWCCRCCGQCGGARNKRDPQDKCMFGLTITLVLIVAVLFIGVVLSFYSNEQSFDSIESLQQTMNGIVDTAVGYMNTFLDQGDAILCRFIQITDIALSETDRLNGSLNTLIEDVSRDVDQVLRQLDTLSAGIEETDDILVNISMTTQRLQTQGDTLSTTLNTITSDIETLRTNCVAAYPAPSTQCDGIPEITSGADYNNLPNVTGELNAVQNSLDNINIENSIAEGRAEFDRLTNEIQSGVNEHLGQGTSNSSGVFQSLTDANTTLFDTRDTVTGDVREVIDNNYRLEDCPTVQDLLGGEADNITVNVGFIRQCYMNQFFEQLQEYDQVRYGFGIVICCLALVTVILTLVGVILGVIGWRKDRSPDSRTRASHCGGIFLLVTVGLTFLFGFLLLILACLAFFFGSNMQKICQAIEPPEYELYTRILDNRELWGGSLLGNAVFGNGQETLSLSVALRSCEADEALYSAFNLSLLFDVRSQILDTSEIFDNLRTQVDDTVDSFNYTEDSFLNNETRTALDDFASANVQNINLTAFRDTLSADPIGFNITEAIANLTALRAATTGSGLEVQIDSIITQLMDVRDNQIPAINADAEQLDREVNQLGNHTQSVVLKTAAVEDEISSLVTNLTGDDFRGRIRGIAIGTLNNLENYINSFINYTVNAIENDVGRCQPLATIYSSAYSTVCNEVVDGLNGYWWSLGFCCLCFIPLIIFAVLTSTHYLRQKPWNDDGYHDFPMEKR